MSAVTQDHTPPPSSNMARAAKDIFDSLLDVQIWTTIAWNEVLQRYRRSTLGPFWMTLTMGVQAAIFGTIFPFLFGFEMDKFLPYVCAGLPIWGYITGSINESAGAFSGNAGVISQVRRPLMTYVWLSIMRNVIILLHSLVIFFVVAIPFKVYPTIEYVWLPLNFLLVSINLGWMGLLTAIIATRFRDVPMIVVNIFNVLLWLTPILYFRENLREGWGAIIVSLNPFTYLLELLRGPLMGEPVQLLHLAIAGALAVAGWTVAYFVFAFTRHKIPYWL